MLLTAVFALLAAGTSAIVGELQRGGAVSWNLTISAALVIAGAPFFGGGFGYLIASRTTWISQPTALALGVLLGYLIAFGCLGAITISNSI